MNILVFGDSIAYGANDLELGGWVNRLGLHLDKKYDYDYNVFNFGVSGEITTEVLARFDSECKARCGKQGNETVIIFAIGINDTSMLSYNTQEPRYVGVERQMLGQFHKQLRDNPQVREFFMQGLRDRMGEKGFSPKHLWVTKESVTKINAMRKANLKDDGGTDGSQ